MAEQRKNDYGFPIQVQVKSGSGGADISAASYKAIRIGKPPGDSVVSTLTASFISAGASGYLSANAASGLVNTTGEFSVQAVVSGSGFRYSTERGFFSVSRIIT